MQEGKRTTPISCIYAIGVSTPILIAYYRCGVLYRLFLHRSFHNLLTDKRNSTPHFLYALPKPNINCLFGVGRYKT